MDESCVDCDCVITDEGNTAAENAARWALFTQRQLPVGPQCDGTCDCHDRTPA